MEDSLALLPQVSIQEALNRYQMQKDFIEQVLKEGVDYGEAYPGSIKKTLLKPGAEKLDFLFGLSPTFVIVKSIENWGEDGTEPLFYYWMKCQLYHGDRKVAEGEGSCSSWETKYRYRKADLVCPECGKEGTIIKGKKEYGGGWLCYKNKGGCGYKWDDGDLEIDGQERGQVPNRLVFDQVNTILKMAEKRALIAATLIATNSSEYFTQDIEDFVDGTFNTVEPTYVDPIPAKDDKKAVQKEKPVNSWSKKVLDKMVEKGIAKSIFNASAILKYCPLDFEADDKLILGWANHYRTARDSGESTEDAASTATQALAEYLEKRES